MCDFTKDLLKQQAVRAEFNESAKRASHNDATGAVATTQAKLDAIRAQYTKTGGPKKTY